METVRHVDITALAAGTVLLIDTEGDGCWKLVIEDGHDELGHNVSRLSAIAEYEEDTEESEPKMVIVTAVRVGKPIAVMDAPKRNSNNIMEIGSSWSTGKVERIEIYE